MRRPRRTGRQGIHPYPQSNGIPYFGNRSQSVQTLVPCLRPSSESNVGRCFTNQSDATPIDPYLKVVVLLLLLLAVATACFWLLLLHARTLTNLPAEGRSLRSESCEQRRNRPKSELVGSETHVNSTRPPKVTHRAADGRAPVTTDRCRLTLSCDELTEQSPNSART